MQLLDHLHRRRLSVFLQLEPLVCPSLVGRVARFEPILLPSTRRRREGNLQEVHVPALDPAMLFSGDGQEFLQVLSAVELKN